MPKKLPFIPDEIIGEFLPEDFYKTEKRYNAEEAMAICKEANLYSQKMKNDVQEEFGNGILQMARGEALSGNPKRFIETGMQVARDIMPYLLAKPSDRFSGQGKSVVKPRNLEDADKVYETNKHSMHYISIYSDLWRYGGAFIYRRLQDSIEFQRALEDINETFTLVNCNLSALDNLNKISGIYFMVLGGENAFYAGYSKDIRARIIQHWQNHRNEDYGWPTTNGIDAYPQKCTTAILYFPVCKKEDYHQYEDILDDMEMNIIAYLKENYEVYTLNCDTGGKCQKENMRKYNGYYKG